MTNPATFFAVSMMTVILMAVIAFYCILVSRNLIRILIGLELLTKGVTLLLGVAGYLTGRMAMAQTFIITVIVIEVVVIAVAAGVVLGVHRTTQGLDAGKLNQLRG